jgi:hypothetical protein
MKPTKTSTPTRLASGPAKLKRTRTIFNKEFKLHRYIGSVSELDFIHFGCDG